MEYNLSGRDNMKPSKAVKFGVGAKCLHHCLVIGLSVIGVVNDNIRIGENLFDIAIYITSCGHKISFIVGTNGAECLPIFFWVNENWIVLCSVKVKNCF